MFQINPSNSAAGLGVLIRLTTTPSKDEAVRLTPIVPMTLEQAIAYIEEDELVEVTPQSIRIRKKNLSAHERKRAARAEAE